MIPPQMAPLPEEAGKAYPATPLVLLRIKGR